MNVMFALALLQAGLSTTAGILLAGFFARCRRARTGSAAYGAA